ncbi:DUF2631 domain-containing protein [Modestobacter sp. URMC 112]
MSEHSGRGMGHQTSAGVVEQSAREEGIQRAGAVPIQHESPEEWGWHHEMGKYGRLALVLPIVFLFAMVFGNHQGDVENLWLIGSGLTLVVILIWDVRRRKNAWRSR